MALVGFGILSGFHSAMNLLGRDKYDVITNLGYTVFPLVILMGRKGFNGGIAVSLDDTAHKSFGQVPGGLPMATVMGGVRASRPSAAHQMPPLLPSQASPSPR
jgi:TRAP-type mannitol/chloroaromatic compound transport system permease large subunit